MRLLRMTTFGLWAAVGLSLFASGAHGQANGPASRRTLALTTSAAANQPAATDMAESLLALTQLAIQEHANVAVVERQQLDLALQELALQGFNRLDDAGRLQLGRLLSADLLVALIVERDPRDDGEWRTRLRIVESLTGRILGVAVAPCAADSLEDVARQFAAYIASAVGNSPGASRTIAVAPFESRGRFDRLRPLELGVRDLLTAALIQRSGIPLDRTVAQVEPLADPTPRFQVLQRSDLGQLLRELELLRSGLVDRERLAATLPTRATSYLVRGTLDERELNGQWRVAVEGELVSAASQRALHVFRIDAAIVDLASELGHEADRIVARLVDDQTPAPASPKGQVRFETQWLLDRALQDLQRFRRYSPIDASLRPFPLKPRRSTDAPLAAVQVDSPLGSLLLRKSIDRLETTLLIQPDSASASLALGFCRAYYVEGVRDLERSDALLRKAFASAPEGALGASALMILAESGFHHQSRQVDPTQTAATVERVWYALEHMPVAFRDERWSRLASIIPLPARTAAARAEMLGHVQAAFTLAESQQTPHRATLAMSLAGLVRRLLTLPGGAAAERDELRSMLLGWARRDDRVLVRVAAFHLGGLAEGAGDKRGAAGWFESAATALRGSEDRDEVQSRENLFMHAARSYREAGELTSALRILETMPIPADTWSLNRGHYGLELGQCYEAAGEPARALRAYVEGAERCPSIADNSDVAARIERLGGVPLDEHRAIDVRYVSTKTLRGIQLGTIMVSDETNLYLGARGMVDAKPWAGIVAYAPATDQWRVDARNLGQVAALAWDGSRLWIGTLDNGLWRGLPGESKWEHWTAQYGLPDQRIQSLLVQGRGAVLGVGSDAAGGIVRMSADDAFTVDAAPESPRSAPTHLAATHDRIVATCLHACHEFSVETASWRRRPAEYASRVDVDMGTRVFVGADGVWGSRYGHELFRLDASAQDNQRYQPAWFPKGQGKAGVSIDFLAERQGEVWMGGREWDSFNSCGLYRFDPRTGKFDRFGPRDGFRPGTKRVSAGAWLEDELWLLTSRGLARVIRR